MTPKLLNPTLFVLTWLTLSLSLTAVAQESARVPGASALAAATATEFLNSLPACDLLDLTSDGVLAQMSEPSKVVDADWLQLLRQVSPTFYPIPFQKERAARRSKNPFPENEQAYSSWPKNDRTRDVISRLALRLKQAETQIALGELIALADLAYARAKLDQRVGECYKISQVTGSWNLEWTQIESLSPETQATMDQLFRRPLTAPLSAYEVSLLRNERFTPEELAELRALRVATKLFEQHTSLRIDKGGYAGNLPGVNTQLRTVCRTEAQTYYFFVRRLQARGLLKHFHARDAMALRKTKNPFDGHGGTLLQANRTQDLVVLDSWHEDGGSAAHITMYADWIGAHDKADIVSDL